MSDDDERSTVAYAVWQWDCEDCGEVNVVDHDPSGETVACDGCGAEYRIEGTR